MISFTSSFISLKNRLEGETWTHMIDVQVNVNTTAYFTSYTDTLTSSGHLYIPVPFVVGIQEDNSGGQLPQLQVSVSNYDGQAFKFAKDNDLSLNTVVIRMLNVNYTEYGAASITLQIMGSVFSDESAQFILGYNFNYDTEGPRRTWNRKDFPSIPFNSQQWAIV